MSEINEKSEANKTTLFYDNFHKQKYKHGLQRKNYYKKKYNNFEYYSSKYNFKTRWNCWRKTGAIHKRSRQIPENQRSPSPFSGTEEYNLKKIQETSDMIKKRLMMPESDDVIDASKSPPVNIEQPMEIDKKTKSESEKCSVKTNNKKIQYNVEEIHQKIITHITKLSHGKKMNLICANSSGYDIAIQQIHKQKRLELSKALRDMCSNQNVENSEVINSIIPDIGIKLEDLPIDIIRELSSTLNLNFSENDEICARYVTSCEIKKEITTNEENSESHMNCEINIKQEPNDLNSELMIKNEDVTNQLTKTTNFNSTYSNLCNSADYPINVSNIKEEILDMESDFITCNDNHFIDCMQNTEFDVSHNESKPVLNSIQTVSVQLQTELPISKSVSLQTDFVSNQNRFEMNQSDVRNLDDAIKTMFLIDSEIKRLTELRQSIFTDLQNKQNNCNENLPTNIEQYVNPSLPTNDQYLNENIPTKVDGYINEIDNKDHFTKTVDSGHIPEKILVIKCTPPEVAESTKSATNSLVPTKSQGVYEAAYQKFIKWCREKNFTIYSENVLLTYFAELANKMRMKSSTMWSQYSMIKPLLNNQDGVDISKYLKLRAYLKKQNEGYSPKKSRILTKEQFQKFLYEASDEKYLGIKIILVIGISGACRCDELVKMTIDDVKDTGSLLQIKIHNNKTNKTRSFTVSGENYLNLYRKYVCLRPKDMNERRLFLKYQNGRCHRTVMGIHKIGSAAKEVASYLKLPNWKEYTGDCLRKTSATLLLDGGTDISYLKRSTNWKAKTITEGYINKTLTNIKKLSNQDSRPGTSNQNDIELSLVDSSIINAAMTSAFTSSGFKFLNPT